MTGTSHPCSKQGGCDGQYIQATAATPDQSTAAPTPATARTKRSDRASATANNAKPAPDQRARHAGLHETSIYRTARTSPPPIAHRGWAWLLLVAMYCYEEEYRRRGRRHKTPPELLGQLLRVLLRWFPQRHFVCTADGNFATHALARLAARYAARLTYLSHFYANANLYEPPPPPTSGRKGQGRPRTKGQKLPAPRDVVKQTLQRQRLT